MCTKTKRGYYKLMGCLTLLVMLGVIVGLIVRVTNQFSDHAGFWPITATFLAMLATLIMGSGFANLFYSHSFMITPKKND